MTAEGAYLVLLALCGPALGLPAASSPRSWGLLQPVVDLVWSRSPSRVSYWGHQVLRVSPRTARHVRAIENLHEDVDGLQLWSAPARNKSADLLVPPSALPDVKDFLAEHGLEYTVLVKDLQVLTTLSHTLVQGPAGTLPSLTHVQGSAITTLSHILSFLLPHFDASIHSSRPLTCCVYPLSKTSS
ncbi:hypothetical protein PR048_006524 [Dryococelus australis]|uniref:Carboxypeptidase activation peptide domain-containing protein n=1 Tax=Dryococelus australis TaxID=614101 RepID=A0ABQ9IBB4_9NEOP|nr:hypothetical protein PR048_006524 [Dryococelus australis]